MKDVKYVIRENCKPCKKCGSTQRKCYPLSNAPSMRYGTCPVCYKEKQKGYSLKYYSKNKEKVYKRHVKNRDKNIKNLTDGYIKQCIATTISNNLKISLKEANKLYKPTQSDIDAKRQQIITYRAKRAIKKEIEEQATKKVVEKIHQHPEEVIYKNFRSNINNKNNENNENEEHKRIGTTGCNEGKLVCNGEHGLRFVLESPSWFGISEWGQQVIQYSYASNVV